MHHVGSSQKPEEVEQVVGGGGGQLITAGLFALKLWEGEFRHSSTDVYHLSSC